ncbi:MAG: Uma2 family endonuclease [Pseudomonadota bacterium]|nr:Uma2 family endonuclease [Pseudomonadota bacterium]
MSIALGEPFPLDEFLDWERGQELRYEFDGVQPVAMTGGTVAHSVIASNVARALEDRLQTPCRAFRGDLKVLAANRVRYPDVVVTCAPVPDESDVLPEPLVVFEVLSASTAVIDRTVRAEEFKTIASLRRYIMLEQSRAEAVVLTRSAAAWTDERLAGLAAVLRLSELGIEVPLAEFYRGVGAG